MWAVLVVVVDVVGDESFELVLAPDDGSVEEFSSDGSDPAFCECVCDWCADRGLENLVAFGSEDLVEAIDELAAAIADQSAAVGELVRVAEEQVAGGLGGPGTGGVGGDAGVEHLAGRYVDEEQDVVAAQSGGVDGEEVSCDSSLGVQELAPGHRRARGCRIDVVVIENGPDRRGRDGVAEADEFAVDASMSQGRIVLGQAHHQAADLGRGRWSSGATLWWLGPVQGDASSMPSQQRFWCHDPALVTRARQCSSDRAEQCPIVVTDGWPLDLATQYLELVAKDNDLDVFRASGADC